MKNAQMISVFVPTFVLLILLSLAAPALAAKPERVSWEWGEFDIPDSANPGTIFFTNDVEHGLDVGNLGFGYSTGPLSYAGYYTNAGEANFMLNIDVDSSKYLTGFASGSCRTSTDEESFTMKYSGLGYYTYDGPTFTALGTTFSPGDVFFGVKVSAIGVTHCTSGPLAGSIFKSSYTGVAFADGSSLYGGTGSIISQNNN